MQSLEGIYKFARNEFLRNTIYNIEPKKSNSFYYSLQNPITSVNF